MTTDARDTLAASMASGAALLALSGATPAVETDQEEANAEEDYADFPTMPAQLRRVLYRIPSVVSVSSDDKGNCACDSPSGSTSGAALDHQQPDLRENENGVCAATQEDSDVADDADTLVLGKGTGEE